LQIFVAKLLAHSNVKSLLSDDGTLRVVSNRVAALMAAFTRAAYHDDKAELRIYSLQQRFNLSDPAVEKELYEPVSMRRLAGIDRSREPVPDETTLALPPLARDRIWAAVCTMRCTTISGSKG